MPPVVYTIRAPRPGGGYVVLTFLDREEGLTWARDVGKVEIVA